MAALVEKLASDGETEGVEPAVPASKRARSGEKATSVVVEFVTTEGASLGPKIDVPLESSTSELESLINELAGTSDKPVPYAFYVSEAEVMETLGATVGALGASTEAVLQVVYQPLAVFRVRPVTRCAETMPGHTEAVLHVSYSPDGRRLASGGGDTTVRFWDVTTSTPKFTCKGHKHHVLCTAWAPDGARFASGDKTGEILIWDPATGGRIGAPLRRHTKWITGLAWEPMHRNPACERLASSSRDMSVKVWNVRTGSCVASLTGHTDSVEAIRWGGAGFLYSGSRDRMIKVWGVNGPKDSDANLVRTLSGHAHRVNALALSTDYACRTGPYDHSGKRFASADEAAAAAAERYAAATGGEGAEGERLVSGSDDFTLIMWKPAVGKQALARLTGHQQPVNHLAFSPDGRYFASASFDKKVKLWDGRSGAFLATLTGHVAAVYQVAWSADSRLLVSASKDSTMKLWDVAKPKPGKHAMLTLPGHADEVYALDWSPDGTQVASGSKDRTIKIWRH